MTGQLPPPGWYPDPTGGPGQMYWDGRGWQKGMPGTPRSAASPTPTDQFRSFVESTKPHLERGRRLWSRQSPRRQIMLAVAALGVVVAVVAVPFMLFSHSSSPGHSPSYQAGYTSGSSGSAHIAAVGLSNDFACRGSLSGAQLSNPALVADDYIQGCLNGLRDHPAGQ
jgi:hypothetical protein